MRFYVKFAKLPYVYSYVDSPNKATAEKHVAKVRGDGIVMGPKENVISFDEFHSKSYQFKDLKTLEEFEFIEIETADGLKFHKAMPVNKDSFLERMKKIFQDVPGINSANIYTMEIGSDKYLGIKCSNALIEHYEKILGQRLNKTSMASIFPVCIFRKTRNPYPENKPLLLKD